MIAVKFIVEGKMIYTCEECLYTFMGQDGCEQCPDCGKKTYSMTPSWYIDPEDKATVGSTVEIDYSVYRDVRGTVMQVVRADKNYPPFRGRIKEIREIVELK